MISLDTQVCVFTGRNDQSPCNGCHECGACRIGALSRETGKNSQ
jgi:hypothetical protein